MTDSNSVEVRDFVRAGGGGGGWRIHLGPLEYLDWEGEQGQDDWLEHLQNRGVVPVCRATLDHSFSRRSMSHFSPLITNHHFIVAPL